MRATRAYLASLGTTGLLLASSLLILVVVGAIVAFDGFPGGGESDEPERIVIEPRDGEPAPDAGPDQLAQDDAPSGDTAEAAAEPAGGGGGSGDGGGGEDGAQGGGENGGGEPPAGGREPPSPPVSEPEAPAEPSPPDRVDDGDVGGGSGVDLPGGGELLPRRDVSLVDGLADGAESTTTFLGDDVVGEVSKPLGKVVTGTGHAVGEVLRALDGPAAQR